MLVEYKLPKLNTSGISRRLFTQNRYFQAGLITKILFSFLFASTFLSDLFAPFVKSAVENDFFNVYKDFFASRPNAFPYPPVMLYILSAPECLASLLGYHPPQVTCFDLFLIRFPLLLADITVAIILIKWLRNIPGVVKWYWLNPIVIYVCYVHGQLDIIPTALLCTALYFLFRNKLKIFILFLALACSTKFHIVMAIPLVYIYLIRTKRVPFAVLVKGTLLFLVLLGFFNFPFFLQEEFMAMVYHNHEQSKVLESFFNIFDSYRYAFIPGCYIVILYLLVGFKFVNKDILITFMALSFGIITFFVVPGQGWYLWNIPFFIYFVIRFNYKAKNLFLALNAAYFLFFILFPKSDFPLVAQFIVPGTREARNLYELLLDSSIDPSVLLQVVFTLLQTLLLLFCAAIFTLGLRELKKYKIYYEPYMIGICGDSGTGKSRLSNTITHLFGASNALVVRGDDMHRWERGHEKWNEITHLNPQANWLHKDLADLASLKSGNKIYRRSYDHGTGKFTDVEAISSSQVIIYEGLHAFYLKRASNIYDLKIFMRPAEELRVQWKTERDMEKRGHSYQQVRESIEKRMPDSRAHIVNQETEADIIFSIMPAVLNDNGGVLQQQLRVICSNDIFFEELLDRLAARGQKIHHDIDQSKQVMDIYGSLAPATVAEIADELHINMEDIIGASSVWEEDYNGVMQLFVLYTIFNQLKISGMIIGEPENA